MDGVLEAPVFRPSEEDFRDPMAYIAKIRAEAEAAGLCKIVPPPSWQPPFSVPEDLRFHTRVQDLMQVDGVARVERAYAHELRAFLFQRDAALRDEQKERLPELPDGPLRLYRLHAAANRLGGPVALLSGRARWEQLAKGVLGRDASPELVVELRDAYERLILPFEVGTTGPFAAFNLSRIPSSPKRTDKPTFLVSTSRGVPSEGDDVEDLLRRATFGVGAGAEATQQGLNSDYAAKFALKRGREEAFVALDPGFSHEESEVRYLPTKLGKELLAQQQKEENSMEMEDEQGRRRSPKRGRKRKSQPNKDKLPVKKRTNGLMSLCKTVKVQRKRLCPRFGPRPDPEVLEGAIFYKYFEELQESLIGQVVEKKGKYIPSKDPEEDEFLIRYVYDDKWRTFSHEEVLNREDVVMALCSGSSRKEAYEATVDGICQTCTRADSPSPFLLCDGCDFGYHMNCLVPAPRDVPAGDWFCPLCLENEEDDAATDEDGDTLLLAESKKQHSALQKRMAAFGFGEGIEYSLSEYGEMSDNFKEEYIAEAEDSKSSYIKEFLKLRRTEKADAILEREYWRLVTTVARGDMEKIDLKVSYGSDLDTGELGSGFPTILEFEKSTGRDFSAEYKAYAKHPWNLNNFPKLSGSLLQYVDEDITGVIVPWMYMGMFFSSFCWHTEDHYFASINFHHWGAPKTWYGVPSSGATAFENAAKALTPELFEARPDILTGIVTQYHPGELAKQGVPVYHVIQRQGEFVITFPQGYHGGFNHGLNCAEAVNFATPRWLPFGNECVERYALLRKNPVISHTALLSSLAKLLPHMNASAEISFQIAEYLYPSLVEIISCEMQLRSRVRLQLKSLKEHVDSASSAEREAQLSKKRQMLQRALQQKGKPGRKKKAKLISGRERSKTTKENGMARLGDGAAEKQDQCVICKRFLSLSHVASHVEGLLFCLEHALDRPECKERASLFLKWSDKELLELLKSSSQTLWALARFRAIVYNALFQESDMEEFPVDCPGPEALKKHLKSKPDSPPVGKKVPPGILYTLKLAEAEDVDVSFFVDEFLKVADECGIPSGSLERNALLEIQRKLKDLRKEIQRFLSPPKPKTSWPEYSDMKTAYEQLSSKYKNLDKLIFLKKRIGGLKAWLRNLKLELEEAKKHTEAIPSALKQKLCNRLHELEQTHRVCAPETEELFGIMRPILWVETAKSLLTEDGRSRYDDAHRHYVDMPSDGFSSKELKETQRKFVEEFWATKRWLDDFDLFMSGQRDGMVKLAEELPLLHFQPGREKEDEVNALVSQLGQDANSEINKGSHRWKESHLEKFVCEGVEVDRDPDSNEEWREAKEVLNKVQEWRNGAIAEILEGEGTVEDFRSMLHLCQMQLFEGAMRVTASLKVQPKSRERLFCVCRKPELKNFFMFACDSCDEWYHPECLGTTRKHMESLDHFRCPQCIHDGKVRERVQAMGLYCYCMKRYENDDMVRCKSCKEWFHPLCVGLSVDEAFEMKNFTCPTCRMSEGHKPIVSLHCKCRMPDFGTSGFASKMVFCDCCSMWFHSVCIGLEENAVSALNRNDTKFYCDKCCAKKDVPYIPKTGESGFLAAYAFYDDLKRDCDQKCVVGCDIHLNILKRNTFEGILSRIQDLQVEVQEELVLRSIQNRINAWFTKFDQLNVQNATTVELWQSLFDEASLPGYIAAEEVHQILAELFIRFLRHLAFRRRPGAVEQRIDGDLPKPMPITGKMRAKVHSLLRNQFLEKYVRQRIDIDAIVPSK